MHPTFFSLGSVKIDPYGALAVIAVVAAGCIVERALTGFRGGPHTDSAFTRASHRIATVPRAVFTTKGTT